MHNILKLLIIILLTVYPKLAHADSQGAKAQNFKSIVQAVLERSEQLRISDERINQSMNRYDEALASVYPYVTAGASQIFRNDSDGSIRNESITGTGISTREDNQLETSLSVRQPLFTGFRELLAVQAIEKEGEAQRLLRTREQELLYQTASELFYQIILYTKDIAILSNSKKILEDRIHELKEWLILGKSRESEILQAQSDHAEIVSVIERTTGLLESTKILLSSLSGFDVAELHIEDEMNPVLILPIDAYLARIEDRSDIVAIMRLKDAAQAKQTIAERERWPSLRLEGNAYPHTDPHLDKEWDVLLKMELPLFDAGAISARISQAQSDVKIRRLEEERAKREARRDVQSLYTTLEAARKELRLLRKQQEIVEKSFASLKNDYKNGVVSNLDVLRALTQVQDAKRRIIAAQAQMKLSEIRLEVAAGGVTIQ